MATPNDPLKAGQSLRETIQKHTVRKQKKRVAFFPRLSWVWLPAPSAPSAIDVIVGLYRAGFA